MSKQVVKLLLGSSIKCQKTYLKDAKVLINRELGEIKNSSILQETEPIGFSSNSMVFNQIIELKVSVSPIELLRKVKSIEKRLGRKQRTPKKGEVYTDREIDIDILEYSNINYVSGSLVIPHKQIKTRKFVKNLMHSL